MDQAGALPRRAAQGAGGHFGARVRLMSRGWVLPIGFAVLSCHPEGTHSLAPRVAPIPTSSATPEVRGKVSMCLTNSSFEPLGRLPYRLLEGDQLVHQGETNDTGCMERRGLPPGHYYLRLEGYEPLAALLLDEKDSEPLVRALVRSGPSAPR